MSAVTMALTTFTCILIGVLLGLYLRTILPDHHLKDDSKDVVKLGAGLIATLAALVLGLLVGSAKSSFDQMNDGLKQGGARLISLDRILAKYGSEAAPTRELLRRNVAIAIELMWPTNKTTTNNVTAIEEFGGIETVHNKLRELAPRTEAQRALKAEALQLSSEMGFSRWLMIEHTQNMLPLPFLIVLVFWLTMLHLAFGILAPRNGTVIAVLILCAISVSGAIFLIVELNHPTDGIIKLSSAPLEKALALLGK